MRRLTVDSRLLGAALLAATAAAFVLVSTRPPPTTQVLVSAGPAAAGTEVSDLELVERPVSDPTGLVAATRLEDLDGSVLAVGIGTGVPLTEAVLAAEGSAPDVIGLELPAPAAVHGALVPGDRVDVHVATEDGPPLALDVPVVAVFVDSGALGADDVGLLVAVDGDLAQLLVGAIAGEGIHLVRSGG